MGFNSSSSTVTLTAKLTPMGRQKLISTNNALITSFSLGDSDANYYVPYALTTGQIPAVAGEVGPNSTTSNSTPQNANLKSVLVVNSSGVLKKSVESNSTKIISELVSNGSVTLSGTNITKTLINRNDYNTDSLVNLFYSFGLPLNSTDDIKFTGVTFANGGYSDTAFSGLSQTKILVIGINNANYGELLDGKTAKLVLPTSAGTYTIYSTFQNKGTSVKVEDANVRETSVTTEKFDPNVSMLFSDTIMKPNGGVTTLSWATGYGLNKPFSVNGKQLFNAQTNTNIGLTADTIVGVAYLDKGFLVITHPTIVNNYNSAVASAATVTFNSVSTSINQVITCIADRGEFGGTTNPTFSGTDVVRISEVGLYDSIGNLIAVAKTDRHITKNVNEFLALSIEIDL